MFSSLFTHLRLPYPGSGAPTVPVLAIGVSVFTAALMLAAGACGDSTAVDAPVAERATAEPTVAAEPTTTQPALGAPSTGVEVPTVSDLSAEALDLLVELTQGHSPRASATAQETAAAEYIAGLLSDLGLATEIRPFTVDLVRTDPPVLVVDAADALTGRAFPLTLSAEGEASGVLAVAGRALAGEVEPGSLAGRVALVERGTITFQEKVSRVEEAGAVAAIVYNNRPGAFAGRLATRSGIPAVSVSRAMGEALIELMGAGDVRVKISVVIEARDSANVVAEFSGTDPDAGVVVLGGHYDTVPGVDGANDNGSGIAVLLTVARHAAGRSYPFGLRFIMFGAEEEGLLGSQQYLDSLDPRGLSSIVAMLNFDALGSGETVAMIATARLGELVLGLAANAGIAARLDASLGLNGGSSDFAPFEAAGVPYVFFFADDFSRIHTEDDTVEFIDALRLGESAALGLATLDALAAGP